MSITVHHQILLEASWNQYALSHLIYFISFTRNSDVATSLCHSDAHCAAVIRTSPTVFSCWHLLWHTTGTMWHTSSDVKSSAYFIHHQFKIQKTGNVRVTIMKRLRETIVAAENNRITYLCVWVCVCVCVGGSVWVLVHGRGRVLARV